MTLHIFPSAKKPELFGFTIDATGANVPLRMARGGVPGTIPLGTTMASSSPQMGQQIVRYGYALVEGHSVSEPRVPKTESKP